MANEKSVRPVNTPRPVDTAERLSDRVVYQGRLATVRFVVIQIDGSKNQTTVPMTELRPALT